MALNISVNIWVYPNSWASSPTGNSQPVADFSLVNTGVICGNDSVKIKNTSTIAIGKITRLEVIWDSVNRPTVKVTDTFPSNGKMYAHRYQSTATNVTYKVVVRTYSGQTCMSEKVLVINVGAAPKVKFDPITEFCLNDHFIPT